MSLTASGLPTDGESLPRLPLQGAPCAGHLRGDAGRDRAGHALVQADRYTIMYSVYRERSLYTLYMIVSEARTEEGERGGAPVTVGIVCHNSIKPYGKA